MPDSPHFEPDSTPTTSRRRRPSPVSLPAPATESTHLAGNTTPSWSSTWSDVDTDGLDAMSGSTSPSLGVLSSAGFTSPALSGLENDSRAASPIIGGPPSPLWMATHMDPTVLIDHVDEGESYESDGDAFARMHASWSRDAGLRALEPALTEAAVSHVTREQASSSADANRDDESTKECGSETTRTSENAILPMVVAAGLATLAAADATGAAHSVANSLPHEGAEHEHRSSAPDSPSTTSLVLAWGVSKVASMVARVLAIDDPMFAPEPAHADEKLADVVSSTRAAAAHAAAVSASRPSTHSARATLTNNADDDATPIPLELPTTLPRSASHASLLAFAAKYADLEDPPATMEPPTPIRRRPRYPAPRSDRRPRAPSREVAGSDETGSGMLVSTLAALWRSVVPAVPAAVEATSTDGGEHQDGDEEDEDEMVDDAAPPLFARSHHMDGLDTLGARLGFGISVPDLSAAFPKLTVF
ncbi:hypothetical protein AMAG_09878 [Allomyces macrogynus ATCC 38327]|uniref:Uncharacterized protein n=1 Tax=Allomyces macrogynus (strain ATCC 38327) TaxID=578462 RepID=A0A0L0STP0_ALLM3|nr:hypothetical protein AMAG_09878 [Allomyces macrogynus ATCC 38327]|eukprot:KNE65913.1 hypothetical protein AMAG_09878 [Allomyces macrogynus ATCC 38327]